VFATKAALRSWCAQLLATWPWRLPLPPDVEAVLRDLVARHPAAAEKIGPGIARIVTDSDGWTSTCFWVERVDGTRVEFSYRSCLTAPSRWQDVARAGRLVIADQVAAFREAASRIGPLTCAVSGARLLPHEVTVDHVPPRTYVRLLWGCLQTAGLSVADVRLGTTPACGAASTWIDPGQVATWAAFHRTHARLRIVHQAVNSRGSRVDATVEMT
jgi:hypothetical protein